MTINVHARSYDCKNDLDVLRLVISANLSQMPNWL